MTTLAPHRPVGGDLPRVRFRVMGTDAAVVLVDGDPGMLAAARTRLEDLEARWSRFRPDSDVSRLNAAGGRPVPVAPETVLLVQRAVAGAAATGGRFDPTVGAALLSHGYDRTFEEVPAAAARVHPRPEVDGSWPAVEVDAEAGTVRLPAGTVFDPGGIGKGLAADLVATGLAAEAAGALVDLGGDVRAVGRAPDPAGWVMAVDDPLRPGTPLGRLALPEGAVATSSDRRRRWLTADGWAHHVIDPRTGRPVASDVVAVTVVAAEAWWAEVQATAVFVAGVGGLADLDRSAEALVVLADGSRHVSAGLVGVFDGGPRRPGADEGAQGTP